MFLNYSFQGTVSCSYSHHRCRGDPTTTGQWIRWLRFAPKVHEEFDLADLWAECWDASPGHCRTAHLPAVPLQHRQDLDTIVRYNSQRRPSSVREEPSGQQLDSITLRQRAMVDAFDASATPRKVARPTQPTIAPPLPPPFGIVPSPYHISPFPQPIPGGTSKSVLCNTGPCLAQTRSYTNPRANDHSPRTRHDAQRNLRPPHGLQL